MINRQTGENDKKGPDETGVNDKKTKKRSELIRDKISQIAGDPPYKLDEGFEKIEERLEKRYKHDEEKIAQMRNLFSLVTLIGMLAMIALALYGLKRGVFSDPEVMKAMLTKAGFWGPLLFILLQIIQCVIPIIPGGITVFVGVYLFGPLFGFLLNYTGIYIGEVLCFFLARYFGTVFVRTVVSKKNYEKYAAWVEKNQKKLDKMFIYTMVLPGMPDDIICLFMGLSAMSSRFFLFHLAWTKIPAILGYSLFLGWLKNKSGLIIDRFKHLLLVN